MRIVRNREFDGSRAELEAHIASYAQALADHASSVGVPAPWPEYPVLRQLVALDPEDWILEADLPEDEEPPPDASALKLYVDKLRDSKLGAGFDFDFGDARGVHRFGTTSRDRRGWDQVKALADAAMQAGFASLEIAVRTDSGDVTIAASEWPQIMLAGAQAFQPTWAASWAIKDEIAAGTITEAAAIDAHQAWPV